MIDGNIKEFIDQLYFGQELVFIYEGKKYFIQGWWSDDYRETTMQLIEITDDPSSETLWEFHSSKMSSCAEAFLSDPIWNGKDFLKIQENVVWSDW